MVLGPNWANMDTGLKILYIDVTLFLSPDGTDMSGKTIEGVWLQWQELIAEGCTK